MSGQVKPPPPVLPPDCPAPGTVWVHAKTRGRYIVVCCALREDDLTPCVVYRGESGTWVRPLSQFADGRFVPVGTTVGE